MICGTHYAYTTDKPKYCEKCGTQAVQEERICCKCGTSFPGMDQYGPVEDNKIEEGVACPNCNKINLPEALFCKGCGIKVK